jgi:hypothetical protein
LERAVSQSLVDVLARLVHDCDHVLLNMFGKYAANATMATILGSCTHPSRTGFVLLKDCFADSFEEFGGDLLPYLAIRGVASRPTLSTALEKIGVSVRASTTGLIKCLKILANVVAEEGVGNQNLNTAALLQQFSAIYSALNLAIRTQDQSGTGVATGANEVMNAFRHHKLIYLEGNSSESFCSLKDAIWDFSIASDSNVELDSDEAETWQSIQKLMQLMKSKACLQSIYGASMAELFVQHLGARRVGVTDILAIAQLLMRQDLLVRLDSLGYSLEDAFVYIYAGVELFLSRDYGKTVELLAAAELHLLVLDCSWGQIRVVNSAEMRIFVPDDECYNAFVNGSPVVLLQHHTFMEAHAPLFFGALCETSVVQKLSTSVIKTENFRPSDDVQSPIWTTCAQKALQKILHDAEATANAEALGAADNAMPIGTAVLVDGHGRGVYRGFKRNTIGAASHAR